MKNFNIIKKDIMIDDNEEIIMVDNKKPNNNPALWRMS
jgi:hypothetical protein